MQNNLMEIKERGLEDSEIDMYKLINIFFKNNYEENFVFLSFSDKAKLLNFANFFLSLAKYGTIKK